MQINSIQYLRAFAVMLVVYTHSLSFIGNGDSYQANFYYLKSFGAIGVDLFFVISGFIITYVSYDLMGKQDTINFLKKRFIRVNPSYYFASIIALVLRYISKPYIDFPYEESIKSFTIIPLVDYGNIFWKPILYVGWTLAFEWLFYLIFSLLILFSLKNKGNSLILILGILSFIGYFFPISNIQYQFATNPIVWEFCMGVLIALNYKNNSIKKSIALLVLLIGLSMYGIIITKGYIYTAEANNNINQLDYWNRVLMWGIPSALIVWGLVFFEKSGANYFNNKIVLLVGNASFAIYLIHTLSISLINKFSHLIISISLDIVVLFSLIMSILTGIIYYLWIEKKLIKYCKKLMFSQKNKISYS